MITVLFLCTGNSCRSQMAEGWARHLHGDRLRALSAGLKPQGVNPRAAAVMAEAGVDISAQQSESITDHADSEVDVVFTVCGHAYESCPRWPGGARLVHHGFDDPPALAVTAATEEQALDHYRRVRDQIRAWIETLPQELRALDLPLADAGAANPPEA